MSIDRQPSKPQLSGVPVTWEWNGWWIDELPIGETVEQAIRYYVCRFTSSLIKENCRRWHLGTGCKVSEDIKPIISRRRTYSHLSISRADLKIAVSLLSWHCGIRYLPSRWDNGSPDFCRLCEDEEEVRGRLNIYYVRSGYSSTV